MEKTEVEKPKKVRRNKRAKKQERTPKKDKLVLLCERLTEGEKEKVQNYALKILKKSLKGVLD